MHKYTRKISNYLLTIFAILTIWYFFCTVAGGGILNDLYFALEEIQDLEKRNLLVNPPDKISDIAKREIKLVHNSSGLREYINGVEKMILSDEHYLFIYATLFSLTFILRIYLRKK